MLIVDEEISFVAAIVNVGNLERAAEVAAKSFVIMAGFGNFVAGDRKGSGVERGVFVAVVKTKTNAIDGLAS